MMSGVVRPSDVDVVDVVADFFQAADPSFLAVADSRARSAVDPSATHTPDEALAAATTAAAHLGHLVRKWRVPQSRPCNLDSHSGKKDV